MKELIILFLSVYGVLGALILLGSYFQESKEKKYLSNLRNQNPIKLKELAVIIPFRNERNRIQSLLESINNASKLPCEFIFVDDHSTDDTAQFIDSFLSIKNYTIIKANLEGKKNALQQGISLTTAKDILTFDADISFNADYFANLEHLERKDMLILPVRMVGKTWRKLFEIDIDFTNAVNFGMAGFSKPIIAAGANLFFAKSTYEKFNKISEHAHIASGDDAFLLSNFKKNDCSIQLISDKKLAISTATPATFNEYFQQRLRWIAKTTALKDWVTSALAIIQLLLNLGIWTFIILLLVKGQIGNFYLVLFTKFLIDFCCTMKYYYRIGKILSIIPVAIHQFWTPLLSFSLAIGMLFYKPSWKGRKITSKL